MNKFWGLVFNWYTYLILFFVSIMVFGIFLPGSNWIVVMLVPMMIVAVGAGVRDNKKATYDKYIK
jgi:hypothetical protein